MTTEVRVDSLASEEQRKSELVNRRGKILSEDEELSYHRGSEQEDKHGHDRRNYNPYSCSNLQRLHNKHIDNGVSFIAATAEIVDMLGGIDQILSDYLSANNRMLLNEIQKARIHEVLSKPPLEDHKNEAPKDYTYLFLIQSTSIHLCCNKQAAQKMINFIFHKFSILALSILGIVLLVFQIGIEAVARRTWFLYYELTFYTICVLWLCLVLLAANHSALMVVAKTFEFVLKLLLAIFAIAMEYIWHFAVNDYREQQTLMQNNVLYVSWLALLLLIIAFSGLDALYIALWIKGFFGFVLAVALIAHTWTISKNNQDDVFEFLGTTVSLVSLAVSALQFLLLFVIKQTILSLLKKEKIISVKSSPYIKWVNDTENSRDDQDDAQ